MRTAIYIRVSTEEQTKGFGPEVQERECREYAAKRGYTVVGIYNDPGFSGALENRPDLDRLLKDGAAKAYDVLLTWKFDRLYRVTEYQTRARRVLAEQGIVWQSVKEPLELNTSVGNLQHTILAGFAEWERDVIKERTSSGRKQKARNGRQPSTSFRPYGYRIVHRADAHADPSLAGRDGEYLVLPEEAATVRRIFALYRSGASLWEICRKLADEGVRTLRGGQWRPNTLTSILRNPVYAGTAYHGRFYEVRRRDPETGKAVIEQRERPFEEWTLIPAPALIAPEDFDQVQTLLGEGQRRKSGRPDRVYPLTGLIQCGRCGRHYRGTSKWGGRYRYYGPPEKSFAFQTHDCEGAGYWTADRVEQNILELLAQTAQDPERIGAALERYWQRKTESGPGRERERLQEELSTVERQLRSLLVKELEDPAMSDLYADLKRQKSARRQELQARIAHLPAESPKETAPTYTDVRAVCAALGERLRRVTDLATRRAIFHDMVDQVSVEGDGTLTVSFRLANLFKGARSFPLARIGRRPPQPGPCP